MGFVPYHCLHVPVQATNALRSATRVVPVWLLLPVIGLAYWWCGPWLFLAPTLAVTVLAAIILQLSWLHPPTQHTPDAMTDLGSWTDGPVSDAAGVTVGPVTAGTAYVCLRCQGRMAVSLATVRGQRIPLCGPCLAPALDQIEHAAARALTR